MSLSKNPDRTTIFTDQFQLKIETNHLQTLSNLLQRANPQQISLYFTNSKIPNYQIQNQIIKTQIFKVLSVLKGKNRQKLINQLNIKKERSLAFGETKTGSSIDPYQDEINLNEEVQIRKYLCQSCFSYGKNESLDIL